MPQRPQNWNLTPIFQAIAREAHLHADQQVCIRVGDGRVIIEPVTTASPSLEDRLQQFDPVRHGGEVMAAPLRGAERW